MYPDRKLGHLEEELPAASLDIAKFKIPAQITLD